MTELGLKPSFKFKAGQFAFISVKNGQIPPESHPFTISSGPTEEALRFTIKSLGDYTADIANKLSALVIRL